MKIHCVNISACLIAAASLWCMSAAAQQNLLVNGDFEDTTDWGPAGQHSGEPNFLGPPGWIVESGSSRNPVDQQSGENAIGGSGTSAYFPVTSATQQGSIYQFLVDPTLPDWQIDADFASEDPGGSNDRSFTGSIGNTILTFRVNGDGDFQLFDSDGFKWHTPAGLEGSVIFDDDVQTTPLTHHVTFAGKFDQPAPAVDVIVTDSDNNVYQSLGLADRWNSGSPQQGDGISEKVLELASNHSTLNVGFVVDNFSLTEVEAVIVRGDYNGNGVVDAADYTIWQDNLGLDAAVLGGKGSGAETVVDTDYTLWKTNFGQSEASSSEAGAVPEPATLLLALLALAAVPRRVRCG